MHNYWNCNPNFLLVFFVYLRSQHDTFPDENRGTDCAIPGSVVAARKQEKSTPSTSILSFFHAVKAQSNRKSLVAFYCYILYLQHIPEALHLAFCDVQ
jgi:hypothetical protein